MENFKYVFIPAKAEEPIVEHSASKSGGLEQDNLRISAEERFRSQMSGEDEANRKSAAARELIAQGLTPEKVNEVMSNFGNNFGSGVEIMTIMIATPQNNFTSVSLYCDANVASKTGATENSRASNILKACGNHQRTIFGDCFIGRCCDDESKEWERLDFPIEDAREDAPWVRAAAAANSGKNLSSYTSSGAMQAMQNQMTSGSNDEQNSNEYYSWNQTDDEVEVKFQLPSSATAKALNIKFGPSSLQILAKVGETPVGVGAAFQGPTGATLAGKILVSDSTWTLTQESDVKFLTVTLAKSGSSRWPSLLSQ